MVTHYIHRGLAKKNLKENTIKAFKYSFKKNMELKPIYTPQKIMNLFAFMILP